MENGQQMRFNEQELSLIRNTFEDKEDLLKLMRKVFLPTYDPYAPLGQGVDLWMTINLSGLNPDQAYIRLLARNELIMHIEQQLMQLNALANLKVKTKEEQEATQKMNSTK